MKPMVCKILILCLFLTGCPGKEDCIKPYTFKGLVEDGASNPISGVEVHYVTHYGTDVIVAVTDTNGEFEAEHSAYSDLGNAYLYFKMSGYQNVSTQDQPIGKGDGTCGDQVIIRNVIMVP